MAFQLSDEIEKMIAERPQLAAEHGSDCSMNNDIDAICISGIRGDRS